MAAVTIDRTPRVPINGASGRCSYVNKPGYMLETPVYPALLVPKRNSDNATGADDQQGSLRDPSETTRQAPHMVMI